jgi:hypothetical protein
VSTSVNQGADAPQSGGSPLDAITESELVKEHPEALVGAAFVGAFVFAKVLKAIGRRD